VVVTLTHPTAYFLELTSFQTLCPVHLRTVKQYGNDWTKPGRMVSDALSSQEWRLKRLVLVEAIPITAAGSDPSDQGSRRKIRRPLF